MTYWLEQAEAEQQSSLYASVTNRLNNIAVHELQRVGVSSGSKVRVPGASPARLKYLQEQTKSLRCREEALRATKSVLRVDIGMPISSASVPPLQALLQSGSTKSGFFVQNGTLQKTPFH